jgi:hypothetical protein
MRVTRMLAFGAALSLAITPAVASSTNPAASLSLAPQGEAVAGAHGGSTALIVAAALIAAIVAGVAMSGNHDSAPASA